MFKKRLITLVSLLLLLSGSTGTSATRETRDPLFRSGAIRGLILSGRNNHDWRESTPFLRKILLATGRFDVRVVEEPAGMTAHTMAPYDVLILDYNGPRWGETTERAVEEFVRSGKGLVVIHAGSYAFTGLPVLGDRHARTGIVEAPWPAYGQMIGGLYSEDFTKGHGLRHSFRVRFVNPRHPITDGMGDGFIATDELYHNMRMQKDVNVLATAFDDVEIGGSGKDEPILWTVSYGKGRVFHTTLGHDLVAMQEPGFTATFARGTEWAATGGVTVPARWRLQTKAENPVRALIVTGGHEHDAAFYSIFDGYDISSVVEPSSRAYRKDLRTLFDTVVMYDSNQEIDDAERKNLAEFLESGKGLVVLHQALGNYNSWRWWYETVVGGRYLLTADQGLGKSTQTPKQELFIKRVEQHPVTAGIGPMHLWDETYKGMWISPDVTVLLRTDNPTSDGPVAWISPYTKSRVVTVQLGHDGRAHNDPGYRRLVRNALLWSAGRTK